MRLCKQVKRRLGAAACSLVLLAAASCLPAGKDDEGATIKVPEYEHILTIIVDGSGSYRDYLLGADAKAFKTITAVTTDFLKGRENSRDRIIIAQISGKMPALLFDGEPAAFAQAFPDPDALRQWLAEKTDPNGSPCHLVVTETLDYLTALLEAAPQSKSCVCIFTDFDDTGRDAGKTRVAMGEAFKRYMKASGGRGAVGCYWVDLQYVPGMVRMLKDAGFKPNHFVVESGINVSPRLPEPD